MGDLWDDLKDLVDQDNDEDANEQEEMSRKSEAESDNPWLKHSDDESSVASDDRAQRGALKKVDRLESNVVDLCDQLELQIDADTETRWQDALKTLETLFKKKDEYFAKSRKVPNQFLTVLEIVQEAVQSANKLEVKTKVEKVEMTSFKKLAAKCTENLEKYKSEIVQMKKREEDGEEAEEPKPEEGGDEDWSEEGLLKKLKDLPSKSKARAIFCTKISKHAEQQGLWGIHVTAVFQACLGMLDYSDTHMSSKAWRSVFEFVFKAFQLKEESDRKPVEGAAADPIPERVQGLVIAESGSLESCVGGRKCLVPGGFYTFASRLFDEIRRSQQYLDEGTDSAEIVSFIQNENDLLGLLDSMYGFYKSLGQKKGAMKIAMIILEIVAPRTEAAHRDEMKKFQRKNCSILTTDLSLMIEQLCGVVAKDSDYALRSSLLQSYHFAIHEQYAKARDLFQQIRASLKEAYFGSKLNEVLANRVIAQLAMSAFCAGNFEDCNTLLYDLCSRPVRDIRQLVGQDIQHQRFGETDLEKELEDRERMYPVQYHFSIDLLRAMSLFSSMVIEVVLGAKKPFERGNRGKQFAKLLAQQSYCYLTGPSTNFEDCIYGAYIAMQKGSCDVAEQLIREMQVFRFPRSEGVMACMIKRIRTDSLKVFIYSFGSNFTSLSIDYLCQKFSLPPDEVRICVSQVLLDRESGIQGSWDDNEKFFTFESASRSRMHHLAEQCSERMPQVSTVGHHSRVADRRGAGRRRGGK